MTQIDADWLRSSAARAVTDALLQRGHQALFVGGCVRNALLGAPVSDLDLSTDARPEEVISLAEAKGIKAIPTGIDHGTVTLVHGDTPIEVTTFRADVATDGRHADVRFSNDVSEDAERRDFTMNALYCDAAGALIDPTGHGLSDLQARRVRFVGLPARRVREDYLRILRFFRFHAWYADPAGGVDAEGLAACAEGAEGLSRISAERIGAEMKKLLSAPDPAPALGAMARSGVLAQVLPGADAETAFRFITLSPSDAPIPRLVALGGEDVTTRLRLSRAEAKTHADLTDAAGSGQGAAELSWRHGSDTARAILALRAAMTDVPIAHDAEHEISRGAAAVFPVKPADLMPRYEGAALGRRLAALENAWLVSGMTASRADLLARPQE
ncbi:MAG: CCA tRNA nucleotidyltransferase [Pseudomonadota bacterium]